MKKTTLALILSSILANVAVAETAPTYVDITINNIKEDTGIELGTNSRARGDGSIATGKNSVAIGKNAVATGGNETKDTINQKLNENKQRLQEIQTAQDNTERLLKELQNIRKQQADVIEAGERVKQVRKSKATAKTAWDTALKAYNDAVASSAADIQAAQAKIDDFNSRLTAVSRIPNVDISSDEGITRAATQFKQLVEEGTTLDTDISFYKDYIVNYYKAEGDLREAKVRDKKMTSASNGDHFYPSTTTYLYNNKFFSYRKEGRQSYSNNDYLIKYFNPNTDTNKNYSIQINLHDADDNNWYIGESRTKLLDNKLVYDEGKERVYIEDISESSTLDQLPRINRSTDTATEVAYTKTLAYWQQIWDAVPNVVAEYKHPLITDADKENMKIWTYQNLLRYKANLDTVYYQWKYEQTHELTWLDKKKAVESQLAKELENYHPTEEHPATVNRLAKTLKSYYSEWRKENITDIETKNRVTVDKLTSDLQAALNINLNAIKEIQARLSTLKKKADDAKSTYENINPSAADLALAANYDKVMRDLLNKSNSLKAEQERLEALKKALTLNDLTNVGENAISVGTDSLSTGTNSIAIGTNTIATGENAIAIGKDSAVTGTNSIAIGTGHIVIGNNAGTFGDPNTVYGDNSYAIGNNNTIGSSATPHTVGTNTFVLGNNVTTTANNAVILGAGSVGKDNTVSVGKPGAERQIINVAAGTLSSTSTDAVNGSQLQGVKDDLLTEINKKGAAVKVINGTNTTVTEGTEGNLTTYAVNVSSDAIKEAVQNDLNGKADVDAGNITGSNIGKWQEKLGNGTNTKGDKGLITGDTLYNVTKDLVKNDLSNITDSGKTTIKNIAGEAIKVKQGTNITVSSETKDGTTTYTINAIGNGKVEKGNTDLVTGDTVYNTIESINSSITNKSDTALSNITDDGKTVIRNLAKRSVKVINGTNTTVAVGTDGDATTYSVNVSSEAIKGAVQSDLDGKANSNASNLTETDKTAWKEILGDGEAEAGNKGLINGDTFNTELNKKADKSDITNINTDLAKKANIDASNINVAKFAEKLGTGTVSKNDTNLVSGKTVYLALQNAVLNGVDVANKANKDASNLSDEDKSKWQEALGTGTAEAGNKGLISGDTLNTALSEKANKSEVNQKLESKADKDASNIDVKKYTEKLATGRIEQGNTGLINGGQVHGYVQNYVADMSGRTLAQANSYTDYQIGSLKAYTDKRLKDIRDEARAGVASAMAMSAIPAVPNKRFSIGAGTATYHGQNAVAIGLKVKTENDKAVISLSGSASSNGDFGASAGFAFGF
ncbi:YadA-like family protein [Gallibacterium anatis]|uniref:YadA-like family protein n=1 Tax=Gallibacterium anatis TaxID=750 RepID=UPI00057FCAF0|nr:YadA-like family protein [Gallibacterium anatis]